MFRSFLDLKIGQFLKVVKNTVLGVHLCCALGLLFTQVSPALRVVGFVCIKYLLAIYHKL